MDFYLNRKKHQEKGDTINLDEYKYNPGAVFNPPKTRT